MRRCCCRTPGTGLYDNLQKYDLPEPEAVFEIGFFRKTTPRTAIAGNLRMCEAFHCRFYLAPQAEPTPVL